MNWNFFKPYFEMIKFQSNGTLPQTKAVFKALADAIIPETQELAEVKGQIQSFGALDATVDEYQIWTLDHHISLMLLIVGFNVYLANGTAEMLNIAARQLIDTGGNIESINSTILSEEGTFAALAPSDRFRAITLIEQLKVDLASLPIPFHNNPDFVLAIVSVLTLVTTNGYYSEWSGYGSTRLDLPDKRKLERFPTGWTQVGYPGPSKGYHALRGYLNDDFIE